MTSTDGTMSNTANSIHHAGYVNSQKVADKVTEVIMLNPEWKRKHHYFHGCVCCHSYSLTREGHSWNSSK
jgi:hypothetical protein